MAAAGRLGIDPRPFTWRELEEMDFERRDELHNLNALIRATMINVKRKRGQGVDPAKLNPFVLLRRRQNEQRRRQPAAEISPLLRYL
jgi:hypothetical protein